MSAAAPLEHCPKCNGLMPADALHCIRCGFELPPQTNQEIRDPSGESHASIGNAVSTQVSWGTIWAQQAEKRRSRRWWIFPIVYLVWFAFLEFPIPKILSDGVGLGVIAFLSLIISLLTIFVLNLIWSSWKTVVTYKESMSGGLWESIGRSIRQLSWTRVFAAVLTSNVFFITSWTGGMVLSRLTRDIPAGRTNVELGLELNRQMSVIAVIPNADNQGMRKIVRVPLGDLERFKQGNPNYSFVLPLGKGALDGPSSDMRTVYVVTTTGPAKVIVETRFHQDEYIVLGRYEATDKEIEPLYTKTSHDMVEFTIDFLLGLLLALGLGLIGCVFKWSSKRTAKGAAVSAASEG